MRHLDDGVVRVPDEALLDVDIAEVPTGGFAMPDVSLTTGAPVDMEIEAAYIPLGIEVEVRIATEDSADQIVLSAPLAGTLASSSTTASVTFAAGFSRVSLHAVW